MQSAFGLSDRVHDTGRDLRRSLRLRGVERLEQRQLLAADPIISEIVASNDDSLLDPFGASPDWIEIYNNGDTTADLTGWYLTDDEDDLDKWRFPVTELAAGEYLVVFAAGREQPANSTSLVTNFRLAKDGEYLALVRPNRSIASEFQGGYPELRTDVSYGPVMTTESKELVGLRSATRVFVPIEPTDTSWTGTDPNYDDRHWLNRTDDTVGVGYHIGDPGVPGLLAEWQFETSVGQPVRGGTSAVGSVDDTAGADEGPFPGVAEGSPTQDNAGLHYIQESPAGIDSSFAIEFPAPESAVNHIRIPLDEHHELARLTVGDFRVESWFRTTDGGRSILIGSFAGGGTALNLELHTANRGRIYIQGSQGTTDLNLRLPSDSRDGQWHHLAGVRELGIVKLFFDGRLVGTMDDVAGDFVIDKSEMYIGRDRRTSGVLYQGSLDNVRFYNSADTSQLISAYDFESVERRPPQAGQDATGNVDDSGRSLHGPYPGLATSAAAVTGGVHYVTDAPPALTSSFHSIQISEANSDAESVRIGMPAELADLPQGDFTLQTWFKTTDVGRGILMGAYAGAQTNTINFELHTNNRLRIVLQHRGQGTTDLNVPVDLAGQSRDGEWHLATAVRRDDRLQLYFDGTLVGQTTDTTGAFSQTADTFYLGRDSRVDDTRFDGRLDDVTIWNTALTADQIRRIADGKSPREALGPSPFQKIGTDVESIMRGNQTSALIRIPFEVNNVHAFNQLNLRVEYSDGFVAYINGQEIGRANAPRPLMWNSSAMTPSVIESTAIEEFVVGSAAQRLRAGTNTLAIQGLTSISDDESFLILPELFGIVTTINSEEQRFFLEPTPNQTNNTGVAGLLSETQTSVERGFYDREDLRPGGSLVDGITLDTESPGATIRYTTDGSWPTQQHGTIYTQPITISTTTTLRAAAFQDGYQPGPTTTHTYLFLDDVIRQPSSPGSNREGEPTYPIVFPTTHQPGVSADYQMDPRVVEHELYASSLTRDLKSIPTLSLVMDLEDLFGQPRGIWSNSQQSGDLWERLTSVEYFDPLNPDREFHLNSAIRIQGRASRVPSSSIKHSFRLIFKEQFGPTENRRPTGGPTKLTFPLFSDSPVDEFDNLILRAGYNYSYLHGSDEQNRRAQYLREAFMRETQVATGQLGARGDYVHLYLNGLYFGLYAPQERPDASFMAQHLGGDKDNYDVISAGVARDGTNDAWLELLSRAAHDLSVPENYDSVLELLDVDNLIDYMIVHIWGGTTDWPAPGGALRNWVVGRERTEGGKFQFFVWDAEYSLQTLQDDRTDVGDPRTPAFLYRKLRDNPEFRLRFADRVQQHFFNDGALTATSNHTRYANLAAKIENAIVGESARWGDTRGDACNPCLRDPLWTNERNWMLETYLPQRSDIVLDQFRTNQLFPTIDAPKFNQHGGQLTVGFRVNMEAPAPEAFIESTLIGDSHDLQFFFPTTDSPQNEWTQPDFVTDAAWRAGVSAIGFDPGVRYDALINTDIRELMQGQHSSVFTRFEFTHDRSTNFDQLNLRMRYDDAFLAYLNGVEIARSNALPAGPVSIDISPSVYESYDFESYVIDLSDNDLLLNGKNVLAIHGLNRGTRSDFLIMPELIGQTLDLAPRPRPIWYTVDGSDPRLAGGTINPAASRFTDPLEFDRDTRIRARVLHNGEWSAISDALFEPDHQPQPGDFNNDGQRNAPDIDLLCGAWGDQESDFDLTGDDVVDQNDLVFLVQRLMGTRIGDADLNGLFDNEDLVKVIQAGEYEDDVVDNSTWLRGDWNCDQDFSSEDIVFAFQMGGYTSPGVNPTTPQISAAIHSYEAEDEDGENKKNARHHHLP